MRLEFNWQQLHTILDLSGPGEILFNLTFSASIRFMVEPGARLDSNASYNQPIKVLKYAAESCLGLSKVG